MKTLAKHRPPLAFAVLAFSLCLGLFERPAPSRADTASAEQARRAGVLSSFAGGQVTVGDLEDAIANKDVRSRAALRDPAARAQLLRDLVRYDLLVLEATRRGYATHPIVLQGVRAEAVARMEQRDLDIKPEAIPAADAAQYFAAHRDLYGRGEQRRASYIQVATAPEARAVIAEMRGKSRSEFAGRAREISTDPRTRSQGGELGYWQHDAKRLRDNASVPPPAVLDAMFAFAKVGDVSAAPLANDGQFAVLMLTALVPASARTLAQVEGEIREQLAAQRTEDARLALAARLSEEHKPEAHPELLSTITLDPWRTLDIPRGFDAAPPDPRAPAVIVKPDLY